MFTRHKYLVCQYLYFWIVSYTFSFGNKKPHFEILSLIFKYEPQTNPLYILPILTSYKTLSIKTFLWVKPWQYIKIEKKKNHVNMNFQIERNTNQIKHNQRQNFTGLVNIFMNLVKYCSYFFLLRGNDSGFSSTQRSYPPTTNDSGDPCCKCGNPGKR